MIIVSAISQFCVSYYYYNYDQVSLLEPSCFSPKHILWIFLESHPHFLVENCILFQVGAYHTQPLLGFYRHKTQVLEI